MHSARGPRNGVHGVGDDLSDFLFSGLKCSVGHGYGRDDKMGGLTGMRSWKRTNKAHGPSLPCWPPTHPSTTVALRYRCLRPKTLCCCSICLHLHILLHLLSYVSFTGAPANRLGGVEEAAESGACLSLREGLHQCAHISVRSNVGQGPFRIRQRCQWS